MSNHRRGFYGRLLCGTAAISLLSAAAARAEDQTTFNIAPQPLSSALNEFATQSKTAVLFTPELTGKTLSPGLTEVADAETALRRMLVGTGLGYRRNGDTFIIMRADDPQGGSAAGEVDTLIVTAQKREEDIQDVPIAISAFTQESLERSQIAGGPDLMTQIPNFTFTKTNFASYSIQIRGIGTQAISATTDPAVAVAFNNASMVRNRFFEQEFYDLQRVEVLRGPQGTLYGRNATAGVVNILSAKPKFNFEAKLSGDVANYSSTRLEGMINLPLVEDAVALRLAGAWTKRDGYATNQITGNPIDGRDLWSTRVSLRVSPNSAFDANLIWEHFEEDDDRLRSGKQLCKTDDRETIQGYPSPPRSGGDYGSLFSQGCLPVSLYSPEAFEVPNGDALPYYYPLQWLGLPVPDMVSNPYASTVQSQDLRVIESTVDPEYRAKSDVVQLQMSFDVGDNFSLVSETTYAFDELFSLQDFNRFNTTPGAFVNPDQAVGRTRPGVLQEGPNGGIFCDPQIGCADRLVLVDLSTARSRQISQELRLSSDFDGPFNFSIGGNFLRYDTEDKYYVFINSLSMVSTRTYGSSGTTWPPYVASVTDNHACLPLNAPLGRPDPLVPQRVDQCHYMDPNPIGSLNDLGHNYFLSKNPYKLISYAAFGEAYYQAAENLKITAGLRYTVDKKEAPVIPSWLFASNTIGHPIQNVEELEWREPTGRLAIDWKPDLAFTDETLLYASYAHGYKAGGSNPPVSGKTYWATNTGLETAENIIAESQLKPKTFDAEFVDAFEIGAKNTLLDGALTLNLAAFYYDYKNYQISQIIDRSAVNSNYDAEVWGLEIEADWRPLENLKLGFKGGYQNTRVGDGEQAIDIMDRTAGKEGWVVVKPFPTFTENCVVPIYVVNRTGQLEAPPDQYFSGRPGPCEYAYGVGHDPFTRLPYVPNPTVRRTSLDLDPIIVTGPLNYPGYPGFDPFDESQGHNFGEGFFKDLGGNELPNAPNFTATITADYTVPLPNDWLMTLHSDLYYQSEAWTRIFNTEGYDKLKAYTNLNLAAIFTNEEAGWKVMAYVKNVMDRDSITGAFLFPDDTGLTTNVFLTEPRLYGIRVTKDWTGGGWWNGLGGDGPAPFTLTLGGALADQEPDHDPTIPGPFIGTPDAINTSRAQNLALDRSEGGEARLSWSPEGSPWRVGAGVRIAGAKGHHKADDSVQACLGGALICEPDPSAVTRPHNWSLATVNDYEEQTVVDFDVGRDVGFGLTLRSSVSAGLRYADIVSRTQVQMTGIPDWNPNGNATTRNYYDIDITGRRAFEGVGPTLSWDASKTLFEGEGDGEVSLDWSLTGGVLFGKQMTSLTGEEIGTYYRGKYQFVEYPTPTSGPTATEVSESRSRSATVPLLGAALGLSYEIQRFKVGAGYRWERYFDAVDVGADEPRDADRTIHGPYFKLSVGFGGG